MFHLATTITTPLSREKNFFFISPLCSLMKKEKCFFLFINYDQYAMIKTKNFFFQLATTITTPWPRERKVFFIEPLPPLVKKEKCCFSFIQYHQYPMMKSESFFSLSYYDHYAMIKREKRFFFIYLLRSLHHDQERKKFFSFSHYVH